MPRYKLTIEYFGTDYVGWQVQSNGPTIQEELEKAVVKLAQEEPRVIGAGRTDSGVHALGQVAHLDLIKDFPPEKIRDGLNYYLHPRPISILSAERVEEEFHARFSAKGRAYIYRILNRRAPPAIDAHRVWHITGDLNVEAMHEAAQVLVGHHDFTSFRAKYCQADSPVKTLDVLNVSRVDDEIHVIAEARSFLHHMVRNLTGTLTMVGQGKWAKQDVQDALDAKHRKYGGPTAPPDGLYLTRVEY